MSHPFLLLFDIDGTLLLTHGAGMRAMERAAQSVFGPGFGFDGVPVGGNLDSLILAQALQNHGRPHRDDEHARFRQLYREELHSELKAGARAYALPGVLDLLDLLRRRRQEAADIELGLLTGNYTETAPIKLAHVGIDRGWFNITAFGDEASSRPELCGVAVRKYKHALGREPQPQRIIVIGDTPRDIECAKANGCVAFAVATGHFTTSQLRDAGADHVAPDLSDPRSLLDLLD